MITIKQLQYIISVTDNQFNISYTAEKLFTSQPSISKQIKLLEADLGFDIFVRNGKALQGLTSKGTKVIKQAHIVLTEYDNLLRLQHNSKVNENFRIAATSTQSNYVLPFVLQNFHTQYPSLRLHLQDGSMDQLIDIAKNREADCIILSGIDDHLQHNLFPDMLMIPCYEWYQSLICLKSSPLARKETITINDLADNIIITYPTSKRCGSAMETQLKKSGLVPNIFATSNDPNTIKKYTAAGMGIGIIAPMAYDPNLDTTLCNLSLENILPKYTTIIAVERHNILKPHVYRFIKLFAPHLTHQDIENASGNLADINPSQLSLPDHIGMWEI
ncbi:MAG: LysR substrate-binding domain-containing protein [Ostreibacterium sp.]